MADTIPVTITAGTLAPPACYSNEQERYDAYIAATTAYITGSNLQWIVSSTTPAPADRGKAWWKNDVNGYPKELLLWVNAAGTWVRIFTVPHYPVSSGGVANALTATYNPTFLSQAVGERYWFIAAATNTAACTFKIDSLPAYSIKKKVNQDLAAGEILANQVVELIWDGTNYQMVSQSSKASISTGDIAPGTNGQTLRTRNIDPGPTATTIWESSLYATPSGSEQSMPAASNKVSFIHGLTINGVAVVPVGWQVSFVCWDAGGDAGYEQYDEVNYKEFYYHFDAEEDFYVTRANTLTVDLLASELMVQGSVLTVLGESPYTHNATPTLSKWKVKASAWI